MVWNPHKKCLSWENDKWNNLNLLGKNGKVKNFASEKSWEPYNVGLKFNGDEKNWKIIGNLLISEVCELYQWHTLLMVISTHIKCHKYDGNHGLATSVTKDGYTNSWPCFTWYSRLLLRSHASLSSFLVKMSTRRNKTSTPRYINLQSHRH